MALFETFTSDQDSDEGWKRVCVLLSAALAGDADSLAGKVAELIAAYSAEFDFMLESSVADDAG